MALVTNTFPALTPDQQNIIATIYKDLESHDWQARADDLAANLGRAKAEVVADLKSLHQARLLKRFPGGGYILAPLALDYVHAKGLADRSVIARNNQILNGIIATHRQPVEQRADFDRNFRQQTNTQGVDDSLINIIGNYLLVLSEAR